MNPPMPASSPASEDLTLGWSVPDGAPSPSPRSTPTPAPSSPSDGPASPTSETSRFWTKVEKTETCWNADVANAVRASDGYHGHGSPRGDGGDNLVTFSETAATVLSPHGGNRTTDLNNELVAYRKATKAHGHDDLKRSSDSIAAGGQTNAASAVIGSGVDDDPLLPLGLDSHRYRCCGNGVVAPVAERVGARLLEALA